MKKKGLLAILSVVLLVAVVFVGTMAYFVDKDADINTFTVGQVGITLDEAKVDDTGKAIENAARVKQNQYHLLPGHTYDKDPTVSLDAGSEDAYVRMILTVHNASAVQAIIEADDAKANEVKDYADLFAGWSSDKWLYQGYTEDSANNTIAFEFRYYTVAGTKSGPQGNGVLEPLFTELVVPGYVTNAHLADLYGKTPISKEVVGDFIIDVEAHAIQAAGFDTAADAWAAFE